MHLATIRRAQVVMHARATIGCMRARLMTLVVIAGACAGD